jgi:hypothetical protein
MLRKTRVLGSADPKAGSHARLGARTMVAQSTVCRLGIQACTLFGRAASNRGGANGGGIPWALPVERTGTAGLLESD